MPGGRVSKYDWDDKKDICYKLFVEEKKTPREIIKYFANHFNCPESDLPSVRLFRHQFTTKWQFPSRRERLSEEQTADLTARVRELWEQNYNVKEIKATLEEEGFDYGPNDLTRIREQYGFRRRESHGFKKKEGAGSQMKRSRTVMEDKESEVPPVLPLEAVVHEAGVVLPGLDQSLTEPESAARRAERQAQLQQASDELFNSRKRRRRIRGYGHLPADSLGLPPRYVSETSIDECKAYLHLSNEMYLAVRRDFEEICRASGIERKKGAFEDGRWQMVKDQLVRENMHLSAMLHPLQPELEAKVNSLDVICQDVTKRIRDAPKAITVAEANNHLGLNPTVSKSLRRAFYEILEADGFTTKLECGAEHFEELRQLWFARSPVLQAITADADDFKMKCVGKLVRDAQKRYNDDKARADPSRMAWKETQYGPGPGPARGLKAGAQPKPKAKRETAGGKASKKAAAELDPALDPALVDAFAEPIAATFRLAPGSQLVGNHPRTWTTGLVAPNMAALHKAASSKAGAASVTRVHGIMTDETSGAEDSFPIETEEALRIYLEATRAAPVFVVALEGGYA